MSFKTGGVASINNRFVVLSEDNPISFVPLIRA